MLEIKDLDSPPTCNPVPYLGLAISINGITVHLVAQTKCLEEVLSLTINDKYAIYSTIKIYTQSLHFSQFPPSSLISLLDYDLLYLFSASTLNIQSIFLTSARVCASVIYCYVKENQTQQNTPILNGLKNRHFITHDPMILWVGWAGISWNSKSVPCGVGCTWLR